jgi:zinc protease
MKSGKLIMDNSKLDKFRQLVSRSLMAAILMTGALSSFALAQTETPPAPSAPPTLNIPQIQSGKLVNGLEVVSVQRKNVPLVTVSLLVKSGAGAEQNSQAGLADLTTSMLLKGTKTRTATQIAEQIEFLGGTINSGSGWDASNVTLNVTSDKLDQALAVMSDVVINPIFAQKEIDLYKTQTLDELNVQLKQPSSLANFVASQYSFGEHSAIGTPESLAKLNRADIVSFYGASFNPNNAVLIFAGDITQEQAQALAKKYFSMWKNASPPKVMNEKPVMMSPAMSKGAGDVLGRILIVDLPNSGQAAVTYAKRLDFGRLNDNSYYYPSLVANSVLGGGYSARLNQEIRIKRGLSYGASSGLGWRAGTTNFTARAQTKNVSAAEVAELVATEIRRLTGDAVSGEELVPRKAVLTGNFGRALETTNGLAAQIAALYTYGLKPAELNSYMQNVGGVTDAQVKNFAAANIRGGDIIIVGDAKVFMDDLKKRFPNAKIEVIPASDLDLNSSTLRKSAKMVAAPKPKTGK